MNELTAWEKVQLLMIHMNEGRTVFMENLP